MEQYKIAKFIEGEFSLDVKTDEEKRTVWLSQAEIAQLFNKDISVISRHINNIFNDDIIYSELINIAEDEYCFNYGIELFNNNLALKIKHLMLLIIFQQFHRFSNRKLEQRNHSVR